MFTGALRVLQKLRLRHGQRVVRVRQRDERAAGFHHRRDRHVQRAVDVPAHRGVRVLRPGRIPRDVPRASRVVSRDFEIFQPSVPTRRVRVAGLRVVALHVVPLRVPRHTGRPGGEHV